MGKDAGVEDDSPRRVPSNPARFLAGCVYCCLLGQEQPLAQSSQQAQSHAQLGQSLQQSSEQQAAFALLLQQLAASLLALEDVPATAAAIRPVATARPPNSFTNMIKSLFRNEQVWL
jgi:hypothetical protein